MKGQTSATYIACRVGAMLLGIELSRVQEINRLVDATFVPRLPPEVRGLINLRGNLVIVLDLATMLQQEVLVASRDRRNVIVEHHHERFGLLVDAVGDVVTDHRNELEQLPSHFDPQQARLFKGLVQLEKEVLLVVDVDAVLETQSASGGVAS